MPGQEAPQPLTSCMPSRDRMVKRRWSRRLCWLCSGFSWTLWTAGVRHCPLAHPLAIFQARRHDQVLIEQSARRPRNSKEGTMALDPGIRDLLQAIEAALAQQPAADDRAQLNELASRAELVRQAVKRTLEDEPPATTATWVRVHAGLPPASRAEPRHARHVQEQGPPTRQHYHLWTGLSLVSLRRDRPKVRQRHYPAPPRPPTPGGCLGSLACRCAGAWDRGNRGAPCRPPSPTA